MLNYNTMSTKNSITTANYIDFDKALNKGKSLLETKDKNFGFYIIVAIHSGLRIGDILRLTSEDFNRGYVEFREQKTNKAKKVRLDHKEIASAYNKIKSSKPEIFISQKGSIFSSQQINRKLKQVFKAKGKNISSHSLRKTFGRRVYETFGETEKALVMLSKIYNHSSVGITRTYLDITQEEIEDIYLAI